MRTTDLDSEGTQTPWRLRPPEQIMKDGNHLKETGSVYLQQHALNPLEWYPWGPEALRRAQREDKPIFLSIGYASCHWCHVMEHEVFEKPEVAAFMNEHFVNIKVDREERPDLDTIYMDAVQAMTGRGGWPMTVLLTPSLKPFFGGTYFPKPRFMGIVKDALRRFKETRDQVEQEGDLIYAEIAQSASPQPGQRVDAVGLKRVIERAMSAFDTEWGGHRGRMKFPTPVRWRFLLQGWRKWGGTELEKGIRMTLDQMAAGGIHDQLGGGFHRYTTESTWLIPHFEKMLYDNAQLASLYFEAAAAFDEPRYLAVGTQTLDFMLKEMSADGAGFYASFDADSGGEEGTFYVWRPDELKAIAGPTDGDALALLLGVTQAGNFEHSASILTWRTSFDAVAQQLGRRPDEIAEIWRRWRPSLYEARSRRIGPGLDKKIVTSWNGLALEALALGYAATGDARYLKAAEDTVELLWSTHRRDDGGLYRASNHGQPLEVGVLDDYAFLAVGLLRLFEVTGDLATLSRCQVLVTEAKSRFTREGGGYYFAEASDLSLIIRPFDTYDAVRPSGNSAMFEAELKLGALIGDPSLLASVTTTLNNYGRLCLRSGLNMAGWHRAALNLLGPFYELIIAGDPSDKTTQVLEATYAKLAPPWVVRIAVGASGPTPDTQRQLPPTEGKRARDNRARAYVCQTGSCKAPTSDARQLKEQLLSGWHR